MSDIDKAKELAASLGYTITDEQAAQIVQLHKHYATLGHFDFAEQLFGLLSRWSFQDIMRAGMQLEGQPETT